jgi:hypothetical protein
MRLMMLALPLIATATIAGAEGLLESHFGAAAPHSGGCFLRQYSDSHLAKHPDQRVTFINLAPVPLYARPDQIILNVLIRLRGGAYASGMAYCEPAGQGLSCGMEGDAGMFSLTGKQDGALLLKVGSYGMSFETETEFVTLEPDKGDDREFLIPNVDAAACN